MSEHLIELPILITAHALAYLYIKMVNGAQILK